MKYIKYGISNIIFIIFGTLYFSNTVSAQIGGNIIGTEDVCPNTTHDYNLDTSYPPGGTEIIYWLWEVEGGIITNVFFDNGTEFSTNTTSFNYAAMVDPATAPSPISIRVRWDEVEEGEIKLKVEKQGQKFSSGSIGIITFTVLVDATLIVDINEVVDDGITYVSAHKVCENDIVYLKADKGTAYLGHWKLDDNMTGLGYEDGMYRIRPKPGFNGYMTITYNTYCLQEIVHTFTEEIWVGPPIDPEIMGLYDYSCLEAGEVYHLQGKANEGTEYSWSFPNCGGNQDCWSVNGGISSGSQVSILVGENSGFITLTATNDCGSVSTSVYVEVCHVSPDGNVLIPRSTFDNSSITVYPNPARDYINFDFRMNRNKIYTYMITNISGDLISKGVLTKEGQIDLNDLPPGAILVNVFEDETLINLSKIILE